MSAIILPFERLDKHLSYDERMKKDALIRQTTEAFARKVDCNIRSASGNGYEYIRNVLSGLFQTIIHSKGRYTDGDIYRRVDYNISICSVFDCARIIHEVDSYLEKIHVQESQEKEFFMHIRNRAFVLHNHLKKTKRVCLPKLQVKFTQTQNTLGSS